MIFTECPYCDEVKVVAYEAGDPTGYTPMVCNRCKKVMWVELSSTGSTHSHEGFIEFVEGKEDPEVIEEIKRMAESIR